jgi:hypothetical protein
MPGILDNKRLQLEKLERQLPQYEQRVALPFEHAEQIEKLETRLREIEVTIENRYKEALAEEADEAKKSQAAYQERMKQERVAQAANGSTAVPVKGAEEMRKVIEKLLANYSLLDAFRENELFYLKLENGPYMPLVIERLIDRVSVAHYNDDGQADPDILFRLSDWMPEEITQLTTVMAGQVFGGYQALVDDEHRPIPHKVKDVVKFCRMWANNIKNQGWIGRAAVSSQSVG